MGSKNRIFLGIVTSLILHNHRNIFEKNIYMSKRVKQKIEDKHFDCFNFTQQLEFISLMDCTIGSCGYDKLKHTINFIAYDKLSDRYILYSLKQEKHHTVCNTIFSLRAVTLKNHYKQKDFKLFKSEYKNLLEEYIKN